ncbi:alanine--glyoxylate aminotransferase family protein [Pelagibius sp. Alg239-R121]|uniref:pyridoxal-phosphate-dependent aminotransferase family protein n=1 Tax=Pelagibius sp. Alg239-R121 TaxID=2993448 RepID=UPI0024A6D384|nr:aminotransferase class V-fold PLP-dependent enzyme [Pelagibius sp. Alg239-R121]
MAIQSGRNFLHTPGPTNIPDRVLRAMMRPAVDLNDPEFMAMALSCFGDLKKIFKTGSDVYIYSANGHGGWEAALVNVLSAGDRVLVPETGHFSFNWSAMASSLGLEVDYVEADWRRAVDPNAVAERLRADTNQSIKAVLIVHTDTATSVTSDIPAVRKALDDTGHPALLMVDTIAALATVPFEFDAWGVDVAVAASQKGLMQPPGLAFNAVSKKALAAAEQATLPRNYWDWQRRHGREFYSHFCGTAPEHQLFALREALDMVLEEGLDAILTRHQRLSNAVRAAVEAWSQNGALSFNAIELEQRANSVTTILVDEPYNADALRETCSSRFNVSLGAGYGRLQGRAFRIGHMGYLNEPMILGALASVESSLALCGIPHGSGGTDAAIASLSAEK